MHPDLVAISNLWQADAAIDRLRAEHETLTTGESRTAAEATAAEAALAEAERQLVAVRAEERTSSRALETYTETRDRTRKMMESGTAPNYAAAEKQLAQCIAKIDQLETEGLDLLERVDAATARVKEAKKTLQFAIIDRDAAKVSRQQRDAPLRAELAEVVERQKEAAKHLPIEWRTQYAELRRKRRPALVNVVDDTCQVCRTRVPSQKVNEVRLGRATHFCPGCGGFVLP